jgi:hypothetical protein
MTFLKSNRGNVSILRKKLTSSSPRSQMEVQVAMDVFDKVRAMGCGWHIDQACVGSGANQVRLCPAVQIKGNGADIVTLEAPFAPTYRESLIAAYEQLKESASIPGARVVADNGREYVYQPFEGVFAPVVV